MFETVTNLPGPLRLKETLQSAFYEDDAPYLVDRVVPRGHYNDIKNKIGRSLLGVLTMSKTVRRLRFILRSLASPAPTVQPWPTVWLELISKQLASQGLPC